MPSAEGSPRCLTCSKTYCMHTRAVTEGEVGSRESGMSEEVFTRKLEGYIDPDTGRRRLTCLSQQPVPEELPDGPFGGLADARAAAVIGARLSGREQLPQRCSPFQDACSCGSQDWEEHEPRDCTIMGMTYAQAAVYHGLRCRSGSVCPFLLLA